MVETGRRLDSPARGPHQGRRPDHFHRRPRGRPDHAIDGPLTRGGADPGAGPAGAAGGPWRADHLRGHGSDRRRVLRRGGAAACRGNVVPLGGLGVSAELVRRARDVQKNAYCPYSKFRVGAALEAADGRVFVGANVESASYGLTICAERMAIGAAVADGARGFSRIVVATDVDPPASPCGACRQLLAEFGLDLQVIAVGPKTERRWVLRDLLPDAFAKATLTK